MFHSIFETANGGKNNSPLIAPVMTFHPRPDLLNSSLTEIYTITQVAKACNQPPIWIPYTYDMGVKTGKNKSKSSTMIQYECDYPKLVSDSHVGTNPISSVKPFNARDIRNFSLKIEKSFKYSLKLFKDQVNEVGLGHPLFHMKHNTQINKLEQIFAKNLYLIQKSLESTLDAYSYSDQLMQFNVELANMIFGTSIVTKSIDSILSENDDLLDIILNNYNKIEKQINPCIKLIGLNGERSSVITENDKFIVGEKKISLDEMYDLVNKRKITISGEMFFAVLNLLGYKVTTAGNDCEEYYGRLFNKAEKISNIWGKPFELKYIFYDTNLHLNKDALNLRQTAATLKVIDKVAARNLLINNEFLLPLHIVDHLYFLGGIEAVPHEFRSFISSEVSFSAIEKKNHQVSKSSEQLEKLNKEQSIDSEIIAIAKKNKILSNDLGYMRAVFETKLANENAYVSSILNNIMHERNFLGGTINNEYQDGVVMRGHRYPSALSLILAGQEIDRPNLIFIPSISSDYYLGLITSNELIENQSSKIYNSSTQIFADLLGHHRLPYKMTQPK